MATMDRIGKTATTISTGDDGLTRVTYHSTNVVSFNDDVIVLNSGGWLTATTKVRMNQTSNQFDLGFRVFQRDHQWFVSFDGQTMDYIDGLTLNRK